MQDCSLIEHFSQVPDPRTGRALRYPLLTILFCSLCAMLCGAEDFVAFEEFTEAKFEWLAQRVDLSAGVPSHDTFGRVFALIDPQAFTNCFLRWVEAIRTHLGPDIISLDGKTLRHSFDTATNKNAIHMVSAWSRHNRLVLGQVKVDDKSNEITAIPALLHLLDITGCIITIDAMGCQKAITAQIIGQGGDYVLCVKDNHPHLAQDIENLFTHAKAHRFEEIVHDTAQTLDKDHGRIETRTATVIGLCALGDLWEDVSAQWQGLQSLVQIERTRQLGDKTESETHYYISSLAPEARKHLHVIRSHWGIENSLHWVLDVAFREDECRVRTGHADQNLASLRHITLNLLRQDKRSKVGIKNRRLKAGWDLKFLERLITG
jgi:predicted transposase YbfD/YdcC